MVFKKAIRTTGLLAVIFLLGLALSSCAAPAEDSAMDTMEIAKERHDVYPSSPEEGIYDEWDTDSDFGAEVSNKEVMEPGAGRTGLRHVIRTGSIEITVKDTRMTVDEVRVLVSNAGGIISNSYIHETREGQYGARLTLRVPEKQFETVLGKLEELGKATNINTELEDVTMHYVDLESRLNNQKAQEKRLAEILNMAENVEEVLEVERELFRVRGEIESMSAQLTRLKDLVNYATLNLSVREETIATETISPQAFHNLGNRIMGTLIGSINFILNSASILIIIIAALLPVFILLALIGLAVWLIIRRRIKRKAAADNTGNTGNTDAGE